MEAEPDKREAGLRALGQRHGWQEAGNVRKSGKRMPS